MTTVLAVKRHGQIVKASKAEVKSPVGLAALGSILGSQKTLFIHPAREILASHWQNIIKTPEALK